MKHRQSIFFIILFLIGGCIGVKYFTDFAANENTRIHVDIVRILIPILLAIILQLGAHLVRAYKAALLLSKIRRAKTTTVFQGLSIGFLFNTLLPWRLGEIVRAIYTGDALMISKTAVFGSIIIERIIDGLILSISFVGVSLLTHDSYPQASSYLTSIGIVLFLLSAIFSLLIGMIYAEKLFVLKTVHTVSGLFNTEISNRIRFIAWSGIYGVRLMLSDRTMTRTYIMLSIQMWLLYFASTATLIIAYFSFTTAVDTAFVTQAVYAGVSAPAGPGYLGTFHIIFTKLVSTLQLSGVAGFAMIAWLVLVLPISMVGLVTLIRHRLGGEKAASTEEQLLINKLYRERNVGQELQHFLEAYFKGEKINQILTRSELENKFKVIKSFKGGSNAHTMLVWQDGKKFVKKITLPQFADKLEAQAEWLRERNHVKQFPSVTASEHTKYAYQYDLAYHEEYYPFFSYIHSHKTNDSFKIIQKSINTLDKYAYTTSKRKPPMGSTRKVTAYINNKVLQKVADTANMNPTIDKLLACEPIIVNGVTYENLPTIVDRIKKSKRILKELASYTETPIHGDMTVDNLIASDEGKFLLLDPNNENDVSTKSVDLGKLYQSLHSGYEFLITLNECTVYENVITFNDSKSQKYAAIFDLVNEHFKSTLEPHEYRSILFHEAVHYCRMLTYRANIDPVTLPVFYATAVKLFNEFMDQYETTS